MSFVHLQIASSYSLLSSTIPIKDLVTNAHKMGYNTLALTDRNVLFGAQAFYKEAVKQGIKPILGLTVDVLSEWEKEKAYSLILLARNNVGFANLLKISSAVETNNQGGIPIKWLKAYSKGIIAISPGHEGEIEHNILQENIEVAQNTLQLWTSIFGPNQFYFSVQRYGLAKEDELNQQIIEMAQQNNLKIVATNQVCYLNKEDHFAYECLHTIKHGEKLADIDQNEWTNDQQYLKTREEMTELFSDMPTVLENTWKIGQECNVNMDEFQTSLPQYPLPNQGITAEGYLRELCMEGLRSRYSNIQSEHVNRLEYELDIINTMGYSDYFLIVWDFMKYARENGILTGPGRGSAAGSIVAYVLFITEIDPIKYHLLFERFLNPERISMPDIDIDFPDNKRDQVIQYVKNKYGELHVAQIITFGTFAAKASLRDIGRVFGLSVKELDALTRTIPPKVGITLKNSFKESKELQQFVSESPRNKRIFETACKIEGLPRHTSTHAAGVVLSQKPLVNVIPILQGHEEIYLTQYSMEYLEKLGLLKMDFLGLRNLSFLQSILDMISWSNKKRVDIHNLPLDDPKVYHLLSKGQTTGIFQLESDGMRKVLQSLQPTEFEDIVAVNALYRPGPMENIPHYIDRKHGKEDINFYHPDLRGILSSTYGVIIYQEQIIQIASKMAGFSLGEADLLRRAVSKKQKEVLNKERVHFVSGAKFKGYEEQTANEIYELIVRFANYGFNRSHAVAYSMIAYQLAYLKANYPTYFMAALLSSVTGNEGKLVQYINELKEMNVELLPPSINRSYYYFQVEKEKIRYSLGAIKGIGGNVLKEIVNARKNKKFDDLFDFCIRVSPKVITRKVLEPLIYAGCFDEFGEDRATLLATIDVAIQHAQLIHPEEADQHDLFDEDDFFFKPKYVEVDAMKQEDKLAYEKSALGLYLSDHPVSIYKDFIKQWKMTHIMDMEHGQKYQSILYVNSVNTIRTKKGEPMAFLHFSDSSGEIEGVAFPTVFKKGQSLLSNSRIVYIEGKVEERLNKKQLIVQFVESIEQKVQALSKRTHKLFIKSRNEKDLEYVKGDILRIIKKYPGSTPVIIHYQDTAKNIMLHDEYKIFPNGECLAELTKLLGTNHVILSE